MYRLSCMSISHIISTVLCKKKASSMNQITLLSYQCSVSQWQKPMCTARSPRSRCWTLLSWYEYQLATLNVCHLHMQYITVTSNSQCLIMDCAVPSQEWFLVHIWQNFPFRWQRNIWKQYFSTWSPSTEATSLVFFNSSMYCTLPLQNWYMKCRQLYS
jgi:hypothetical protein